MSHFIFSIDFQKKFEPYNSESSCVRVSKQGILLALGNVGDADMSTSDLTIRDPKSFTSSRCKIGVFYMPTQMKDESHYFLGGNEEFKVDAIEVFKVKFEWILSILTFMTA